MNELNTITFSAVLKWTRLQKGMTLQRASEATGFSVQYISEMERGKKSSVQACEKLLSVYGYHFEYHDEDPRKGEQLLEQLLNALMFQRTDLLEQICFKDEDHTDQLDGTFFHRVLIREAGYLILRNNSEFFPLVEKTMEQYFCNAGGRLQSFYCLLKAEYLDQKNSPEAVDWAADAVKNSDEESEPLMLAYYSSYLMHRNQLIKSLQVSERAIYMAEKNSVFPLIQLLKMNQAILFVHLRQYDEAIAAFEDCLKKAELNSQNAIVWKIHENICFTYMCAGNYKKAADYALVQERSNPRDLIYPYVIAACNLFEDTEMTKKPGQNDSLLAKLYKKMVAVKAKPGDITLQKSLLRLAGDDYLSYMIVLNYLIKTCEDNHLYKEADQYLKMLL